MKLAGNRWFSPSTDLFSSPFSDPCADSVRVLSGTGATAWESSPRSRSSSSQCEQCMRQQMVRILGESAHWHSLGRQSDSCTRTASIDVLSLGRIFPFTVALQWAHSLWTACAPLPHIRRIVADSAGTGTRNFTRHMAHVLSLREYWPRVDSILFHASQSHSKLRRAWANHVCFTTLFVPATDALSKERKSTVAWIATDVICQCTLVPATLGPFLSFSKLCQPQEDTPPPPPSSKCCHLGSRKTASFSLAQLFAVPRVILWIVSILGA